MFHFRKDIIFRFNLLVLLVFGIWGGVIIVKAGIVMFKERDFWNAIRERGLKYNQKIPAKRGNILSDNGEIMVSSLVKYRIFIDFDYTDPNSKRTERRVRKEKDSIWNADVAELSKGLSRILPRWSAGEFEAHLRKGLEINRSKGKGRRKYPLCPGPMYINYSQYKEIKKLPIMSLSSAYSGLIANDFIDRKKIFGSLAKSTLGDIVASENKSGKKFNVSYGIENMYDSLLRGKDGVGRKEKSNLKVESPAINGVDIQTTLNIEMQDICEKALRSKLTEIDALSGWAILMEAKSGDIKAIVNLAKVNDGIYIETNEQTKHTLTANLALCNLMEPGSIFKTVALAAALEAGAVKPNDSVPHHNGSFGFGKKGKPIEDSRKPKEGDGTHYTITEVLKYSSNIGMGEIVTRGFKNRPQVFTDKLQELGMRTNFKLIAGEPTPYYANPSQKRWAPIDLVSLSYGYSSMMTSINMVAFYNTIANGGDFMKPRLVKAVLKDGEVIEEFKNEIIKENALSDSTVKALTNMLIEVVNAKDGTGSKAKTANFVSAGKTGTARISKNGSYDYLPLENLLSFCGFFPADKPQYTCIVQIVNNKPPRSGGMTSGCVFKEIAEKVMAKYERQPLESGKDTINSLLPSIKNGNLNSMSYLLDEMGINIENDYDTSYDDDEAEWGKIKKDSNSVTFSVIDTDDGIVPDVAGMGAKDAVYLMKRAGLKTSLNGYGRVTSQSIKAGTKTDKGAHITLTLKP
ncbi:MAG: transpeptidase family protein [Bacteroidaceae bacterium]|nr:transpeptidase family protein [Bacteroidaceae bacterium]